MPRCPQASGLDRSTSLRSDRRNGGVDGRQSAGHISDCRDRDHRILMLSALDVARRIEAGELTPAAVIERCAEAIASHEHAVGAFVNLDLDAARKRAALAGAMLAASPLRGLP